MISINIINYNSSDTLNIFMPSLDRLKELNDEYEVVLVDNFSDDGSWEELQEIADISEQYESNRGEARQRCKELCNGEFIVDQVDPDQYITNRFPEVVNRYIELKPKYVLNTDGCMISRGQIQKWPPLQRGEDKMVWRQLDKFDLLRHLQVNTVDHQPSTEGTSFPILKKNEIEEDEFFGRSKTS